MKKNKKKRVSISKNILANKTRYSDGKLTNTMLPITQVSQVSNSISPKEKEMEIK